MHVCSSMTRWQTFVTFEIRHLNPACAPWHPPKALKRRNAMRHSKDLSVTISNLTRARDFISNPSNRGKGDYLTCDFTGFDYQACVQGALQWIGVELPQCRAAARMFDPEYQVPLEHTYIYQALRSLDCGYNDVISFKLLR